MMSDAMQADDPMTPAEFLVVIEWLGLTQQAVAAYLDVSDRTVRNWIDGSHAIPAGVRLDLEDLEATTADAVADVVGALGDAREVGVAVYRSDADIWAERPEVRPLPARWWRMVVARAVHEVPGVAIAFKAVDRSSAPVAQEVQRR